MSHCLAVARGTCGRANDSVTDHVDSEYFMHDEVDSGMGSLARVCAAAGTQSPKKLLDRDMSSPAKAGSS